MSNRKQYCYVFGNYKFTGSDGVKNFTKWRRFHINEINKKILENSKEGNAFCSVQRYATREQAENELHWCDLYFDLDGPFEETRNDACKILRYFTVDRFNLPPEMVRIWYSGGKGFHILVNAEAIGCLPHKELTYIHKKAALFVEGYLGIKTLDSKSIYSLPRMWRIPDSQHYSGRFKTEFYHNEVFDLSEEKLKEMASKPRGELWEAEDLEDIEVNEDLCAWYQEFIAAYEEDVRFKSEAPTKAIMKLEKAPACVQDLLDNHIRQEGSRNKATMTLASYYKDQGITMADAEKILVEWALKTPKELTSKKSDRELAASTKSAIKSVYDGERYNFGCAYIRSLGTGTDKPIACAGDNCPVVNITLEDQITALPENINFQEHGLALQKIYREIALIRGSTAREHYIDLLKERFKLSKKAIREEIKAAEMNIKIEPSIPKPLDRPRDKLRSLVQDVRDGVFYYLIYVPTNKSNFIPRLVTADRQLETVEDEEGLPEDMARWSVDSATPYNVFEWLNGGKTVDVKEVYEELRQFIDDYMWYPDKRFYELVAVWIMTTYVFMLFDTCGYLALIGTKRAGKSRTLEILEQLCFNASKADSMSDAYVYRIVERNRATLLFDEADSLRKKPKESVNERLEIIRSGYKRAGKVGRCEGESNTTVTFSTYSPKAIANVTGLEDALEDRVIHINVERKPKEVEIKKLIFRDLEAKIQGMRNKLYFFGLQYCNQVAELYRTYRNEELEDREAEIWSGVMVIASMVGQELHDSLLSLAIENRNRKELREGLESTEAQIIMVIWNLVGEDNYAERTVNGKYWSMDLIRSAINEQLGWELSARRIANELVKLRVIDDTELFKKRFRIRNEKGHEVKKMCYLLLAEKIKAAAERYSVELDEEIPSEKPDIEPSLGFDNEEGSWY